MIYIICALYYEAKPIIKKFNLVRNNSYSTFQVFENSYIKLVISGTGIINSACAVSYILSKEDSFSESSIINIGVCGSTKRKKGEAVLVNKIHDVSSKKDFYTDILLKHEFSEGFLETYPGPVFKKSIPDICDMEGSGFFKASSKFFYTYQIHLIKIVSDNLDGNKINKDFVQDIIERNLEDIKGYIDRIIRSFKNEDAVDLRHMSLIDDIGIKLRFTESEKTILRKLYKSYVIRNSSEPDIEKYGNVKVKTKNESKGCFNEFRKYLSE